MDKHLVSLEFKVIDARSNTEVAQVTFTAPGDPDIAVPAATLRALEHCYSLSEGKYLLRARQDPATPYGYYKSKVDGAVHTFMLDAGGRLYDYKYEISESLDGRGYAVESGGRIDNCMIRDLVLATA